MELIFLAMWFAEIVSNASGGNILSIIGLGTSLIEAVLDASCLGIYMAIFILIMVYWKLHDALLLSYDLQEGAARFDMLIDYLRKIVSLFSRKG